jgi:hypothetical protein
LIKISDAVREIVDHDPVIRTGLSRRLMNLTQVARRLHSAVEARAQKPVNVSAIAMALSRLQAELPDPEAGPPLPIADRITVQRGLAILTFPNTPRSRDGLIAFHERMRGSGRYLTITEGIREITLIVEERALGGIRETIGAPPSREVRNVTSLSVALTDEHLRTPGVLYRLLQPLALQGINLAEVTSTTREFHVYLGDADVMLALDALYGAFGG